jgi:LuxR family transcriptional regulator, maltose regulon positive regulatory protein
MLSSLVATKLYIPPMRPDHVNRPRLVEYLDSGYRSGRRLTLVSAPAGYGKTSLLSEWQDRLVGRQVPVAWLSLEESDNDPQRFMHYLLAAVRNVYPLAGQELLALLDLPQLPPLLELMAGLVNEVAGLGRPLVLALDDYHLITNPKIHEAMAFLVDRGPGNLHVVLASRHDPLLPLPRLRARGQVTELRLKDLRFRTEEAAAFLRQAMGLALPDDSLAALQERTEGWAAGLQLAAISLADGETSSDLFIQSFKGDDRHILDYLLEEVLARQPAEVQQFLLETAVLDKFCGCMCDAIMNDAVPDERPGDCDESNPLQPPSVASGNCKSQKILDYLERSNLFLIPLDNRREWFRYHNLFSEALRYRLHHQDPGREAVLHRRAAVWYDQNSIPGPAFEQAQAAGDPLLAADIAERWLDPIMFDGQIHQARAWIQALPEALMSSRPEILFRKARVHSISGEYQLALDMLDQLEKCLSSFPDPFPRRPYLWTLAYIQRAMLAETIGELTAAHTYLDQAASWLPQNDPGLHALIADYRGYVMRSQGDLKAAEAAMLEMYHVSMQHRSYLGACDGLSGAMWIITDQGQPHRALQMAEDFFRDYGNEVKDLPVLSLVYERMGDIALRQNQLEDAQRWLGLAFEKMKLGGFADKHGYYRNLLAQVKLALGNEAEVEPLLREAEIWRRRSTNERNKMLSGSVRARIRLQQGNLSEASQWAEAYQHEMDRPYRHEYQDHTLAWIWVAEGKALEALHFLESREHELEEKSIHLFLVENLALQSLALQRLGSQSEALEKLQRALHLAEPEGMDQTFVGLGFEMLLLLSRLKGSLAASDHLQPFLARLLAGFPAKDRSNLVQTPVIPAQPAAPAGEDWVEGLSEREVEVLRWMARGLNNQQIAEQMVVAESTVKKHINHIFGKLGVENRTQALIKARERGLL